MNIATARGIIDTQLNSIKKAHKCRFVVGDNEYELRKSGNWFCPMYDIYERPKNTRKRFKYCKCFDAVHFSNVQQVVNKAYELVTV